IGLLGRELVRLADRRDADRVAAVLLDEPRELAAHSRLEERDSRWTAEGVHAIRFSKSGTTAARCRELRRYRRFGDGETSATRKRNGSLLRKRRNGTFASDKIGGASGPPSIERRAHSTAFGRVRRRE